MANVDPGKAKQAPVKRLSPSGMPKAKTRKLPTRDPRKSR